MIRILIGAPVHQSEKIFEHYINSLNSLEHNYEVDKFFILHNSPNLKNFLNEKEYEEYKNNTTYTKDDTHNWGYKNFKDVVNMKNFLLHKTLEEGYDYFFLVDSDIILHPKTLTTLIEHKKDIVSEVFWTRWLPGDNPMPNAWMYDHYAYSLAQEWKKWTIPSIYEVGYTGACILISKDVIASGVNYSPIQNVTWSQWEDRAFCIRAKVLGYDIFMDTNYPALHLYREEDVINYENSLRQNINTYTTKVIKQGR